MKIRPSISNINYADDTIDHSDFLNRKNPDQDDVVKSSIDDSSVLTIHFDVSSQEGMAKRFFNLWEYNSIRDNLKTIAVNNLMNKVKFVQLYNDFLQDLINEEEFESEINSNSEEYFIELKRKPNNKELKVISDIVHSQLSKELSIDEVAELFSLDLDYLNQILVK